MQIKVYTLDAIGDVVAFEQQLRLEEPDTYFWDIDEAYVERVRQTFTDPRYQGAVSLLAYEDGKVIGRVDAVLLFSRFDGTAGAYLDWICVLKSHRHQGVAQALLEALGKQLKSQGVSTLIGIVAGNEEALRFCRAIPNAHIGDSGIWIKP